MQEKHKSDFSVSIIVPAKNEEKYIGNCIDSLLKQDFSGPYEIIVVDNNSSDRTAFIAEQKDVHVIHSNGESPAAVRNLGAKQAQFDLLAFIDGDCTAPQDWIRKAYSFMLENHLVGAYGGPYEIPSKSNWIIKSWSPNINKPGKTLQGGVLPGGNLIIWRNIFDLVDGFDENLVTAEDDDLCHRVRKNGYEVISDNGNPVTHHGYPRSLSQMFLKSLWHGSSQLQAHGIFGDKVVTLTLLWFIFFGLLLTSTILHIDHIFNLSFAIMLLIPAVIALARIRKLQYLKMARLFFSAYIISIFVVLGRTAGLARELIQIIKDFFHRLSLRDDNPNIKKGS
jgi:glycosyltransferase involved in cell wall biosynthesis